VLSQVVNLHVCEFASHKGPVFGVHDLKINVLVSVCHCPPPHLQGAAPPVSEHGRPKQMGVNSHSPLAFWTGSPPWAWQNRPVVSSQIVVRAPSAEAHEHDSEFS
jgi:hypothetical protein